MKKRQIVIALLIVVLLLLSACTAGTASGSATGTVSNALDAQNPVTITLWHYYVGDNQQALDAAVAKFNQTIGMQHGIIVDAVAKGSIADLEEAVTNSAKGVINADPMPNIFSCYPDKAMEIDALGKLCDLSAYFTEEEKAQYVSDFLQDGIFDNERMLLVPVVKSTELMYVNATAWGAFVQQEGASSDELSTWEGTYNAARAYYQSTDADTPDTLWDGKSFLGFDSVANFVITSAKQLGLDVIDAASTGAKLDEEVLGKIFDIYYKGMALGYFNAVGQFRSDDIKAGDLVAYVGSSSSAAYFPTWIERNNQQTDIDFLPLQYPVFSQGQPYAIQQGAGMCVATGTQQQQQGATVFLKWFTAPEQNIAFAMTTGYLPVQTAAYNSAEFDAVLNDLRAGNTVQNNVAGVYDIALKQITEESTYAAKPFTGSYSVRSILQQTLIQSGENGRSTAQQMQGSGASEEEILEALDVPARFDEWIQAVKAELDKQGIAFTQ